MSERFSCRAFTSRPVPRETIRDILATAQLSASWCNSQPWQIAIASGAGTERLRKALSIAANEDTPADPDIRPPAEYRGVYRERRRLSGQQMYAALGIERNDHHRRREQMLRNFSFFDAPHVAILHTEELLGPYGAIDCGGFLTSFMTAAAAHGVDTIAQAALAMYPEALRRELGLSGSRTIVCGMSFGYADHDHPANRFRTTRAPLDEVATWVDH